MLFTHNELRKGSCEAKTLNKIYVAGSERYNFDIYWRLICCTTAKLQFDITHIVSSMLTLTAKTYYDDQCVKSLSRMDLGHSFSLVVGLNHQQLNGQS